MLFFIKNDQLGSSANTHVAFADRLEEGVRDPACKSLAKLFSLAVDFPKTGFVARLPKEVRIEKYPDFMMTTDKPSYTSQRIIGKLFREVRIISANLYYGGSNSEASIDWNRLRSGYEVFTDLARRKYERFAVEVAKILISTDKDVVKKALMDNSQWDELQRKVRTISSSITRTTPGLFNVPAQNLRQMFSQ